MIDAHTHLSSGLEAADQVMVNGTSPQDWENVADAATSDRVIPFFGLHPWFISDVATHWFERLQELLTRYPHAGIGEIGLDHVRAIDPDVQQQIFRRQLDLAVELRRPISIHCVRAWGKLLEILRSYGNQNLRVMVHGFAGSMEIMRELQGLGVYISVGPMVLDERRAKLRELVPGINSDYLLLETDTQPGEEYRLGLLEDVYRCVGELRGVAIRELKYQIKHNCSKFTALLQ